jgi:hypothetical protein
MRRRTIIAHLSFSALFQGQLVNQAWSTDGVESTFWEQKAASFTKNEIFFCSLLVGSVDKLINSHKDVFPYKLVMTFGYFALMAIRLKANR